MSSSRGTHFQAFSGVGRKLAASDAEDEEVGRGVTGKNAKKKTSKVISLEKKHEEDRLKLFGNKACK